VQPGDHIRYIANAVQRLGVPMTAKQIFAANPDITPNDDIAGWKIFIPLPETSPAEPTQLTDIQETLPAPTPPVFGNAPARLSTEGEYIVHKGDSPAKLAKQFGVSMEELLEANPDRISGGFKIGQQILIPTSKH
jgi:LysM repeat protein